MLLHVLQELLLSAFKGAMFLHTLQASNFIGMGNGATIEIVNSTFDTLVERLMVNDE
jgi:hypothetical protein